VLSTRRQRTETPRCHGLKCHRLTRLLRIAAPSFSARGRLRHGECATALIVPSQGKAVAAPWPGHEKPGGVSPPGDSPLIDPE
jgi:hypothetical protein